MSWRKQRSFIDTVPFAVVVTVGSADVLLKSKCGNAKIAPAASKTVNNIVTRRINLFFNFAIITPSSSFLYIPDPIVYVCLFRRNKNPSGQNARFRVHICDFPKFRQEKTLKRHPVSPFRSRNAIQTARLLYPYYSTPPLDVKSFTLIFHIFCCQIYIIAAKIYFSV